jgi:tetraacyldisaccharide 4'-kinase
MLWRFMERLIRQEGADQGQPKSIRFFLGILNFFSKGYTLVVKIRAWLYDNAFLPQFPLGCQVISVGNVTAGGTGKTPVVEILARTLTEEGRKVAILSRGYRSKKKAVTETLPRVVSDGHRVLLDSEMGGDEPYMLARNLPGVVVLVDKDRVKSGRYAISKFGCDVLVLDDGFQYRRLRHTHEIVLVDSTNPFSNGHLLPRGTLREPAAHIRRANFIFITKSNGDTEILRAKIKKLNPKAEITECRHSPKYFKNAYSTDEIQLEDLKGKKVVALSGIASPQSFENSIMKMGATILARERFSDHYRYRPQEIIDIINNADELGADYILTTEKDAVRLPHLENPKVPVYYMRMEIEILHGYENFKECVKRICFA